MRIVVTGASGNLGTALLRRWTAGTHGPELVGVARRPPAGSTPGVRWVSVDLTRDEDRPTLRAALDGADVVVHLAWGFQPSHDVAHLAELGVGGTRRVVETAAEAGVGHVVHLSSLGAYAPKQDDAPVDESWPTTGVPTSPYSRHKVAAERLLDEFEAQHPDTVVTRFRPGIVGQRAAGSALLRYGLPGWLPAGVLDLVKVLPLDRGFAIPVVHADDVAAAVALAVEQRAGGAYNLAADPPVTRPVVAQALGAVPVHVPSAVLRAAVSTSWHLRLQQLDPGWVDLAFALPLLDCTKAHVDLGWTPTVDAGTVVREVVEGMRGSADGGTPVLRRRTVADNLRRALRHGPVFARERP